jgi:hypothetical protein
MSVTYFSEFCLVVFRQSARGRTMLLVEKAGSEHSRLCTFCREPGLNGRLRL